MLTVVIPVLAVLLALFAVAFLLSLSKVRRSQREVWGSLDDDGIHKGLSLLLKRGYDGAVAIFTDDETKAFIQFRKYIQPEGAYGIEMHFPRAPWSQPYYLDVVDILRRDGIVHERVVMESGPTREVIHADFGQDARAAATVTARIVSEVFKRPEIRLRMQAQDICVNDELVDSRAHPGPIEIMRIRRAATRGDTNK